MNNLKAPILSGTFKNIGWRSFTSVGEMQTNVLQHDLNKHNQQRLFFGLAPMEIAEYARFVHKKSLGEYLESIGPLDLYRIRSKYNNQKRFV